jgi:glycosyltransferase involved in cell wall biosynthesis
VTSVVIAAHNEAAVIGRCLDALLERAEPGEFDITVACNGCTDATAAIAGSRPGVRVLDLALANKAGALNAGDAAATGFPRVYLDADIVLGTIGLRALAAAVTRPGGPTAATPRRELDLTGRPLPVRGYYAINRRLPVYRDALFGRGAIMLSAAGRAAFDRFPNLIADDLFLDSLFRPGQKAEVGAVAARVATPRRTSDLVRRLARVRAGNTALRQAARSGPLRVRRPSGTSWLRDVVMPRPWLLPAGACYLALTLLAEYAARRGDRGWGRDESSRDESSRAGSSRAGSSGDG